MCKDVKKVSKGMMSLLYYFINSFFFHYKKLECKLFFNIDFVP